MSDMKAFLRPFMSSIETLDDLVNYEKTSLIILSVIYYFVSAFMLIVSFHLFSGKFIQFTNSLLGFIYHSNVIGMLAGASLAWHFSRKVQEVKTYSDLEALKKQFYLLFYLMSGIPFMGLIAWSIVYADIRFAFEMLLAFVATVGALYFGDWKNFKSYRF